MKVEKITRPITLVWLFIFLIGCGIQLWLTDNFFTEHSLGAWLMAGSIFVILVCLLVESFWNKSNDEEWYEETDAKIDKSLEEFGFNARNLSAQDKARVLYEFYNAKKGKGERK